ncbi:hypothetical protein [Alicyclobacillus sp.]|uniref:hypothetical protein n=1 Tax=Alicyclobacillus sp. TaxID=61169 RepID=UPI0025C3AF5F|nr:hypothetical protein [Alicyclobacillus sp.]MCL6518106.1 hypothetical protein [Alicyclobacillus sp.]
MSMIRSIALMATSVLAASGIAAPVVLAADSSTQTQASAQTPAMAQAQTQEHSLSTDQVQDAHLEAGSALTQHQATTQSVQAQSSTTPHGDDQTVDDRQNTYQNAQQEHTLSGGGAQQSQQAALHAAMTKDSHPDGTVLLTATADAASTQDAQADPMTAADVSQAASLHTEGAQSQTVSVQTQEATGTAGATTQTVTQTHRVSGATPLPLADQTVAGYAVFDLAGHMLSDQYGGLLQLRHNGNQHTDAFFPGRPQWVAVAAVNARGERLRNDRDIVLYLVSDNPTGVFLDLSTGQPVRQLVLHKGVAFALITYVNRGEQPRYDILDALTTDPNRRPVAPAPVRHPVISVSQAQSASQSGVNLDQKQAVVAQSVSRQGVVAAHPTPVPPGPPASGAPSDGTGGTAVIPGASSPTGVASGRQSSGEATVAPSSGVQSDSPGTTLVVPPVPPADQTQHLDQDAHAEQAQTANLPAPAGQDPNASPQATVAEDASKPSSAPPDAADASPPPPAPPDAAAEEPGPSPNAPRLEERQSTDVHIAHTDDDSTSPEVRVHAEQQATAGHVADADVAQAQSITVNSPVLQLILNQSVRLDGQGLTLSETMDLASPATASATWTTRLDVTYNGVSSHITLPTNGPVTIHEAQQTTGDADHPVDQSAWVDWITGGQYHKVSLR